MSPSTSNQGSLVCVIPTVAQCTADGIDVDIDFASNLEAYLDAFDSVTVLCPPPSRGNEHPRVRSLSTIKGLERLDFVILPEPYREDRYLAHYFKMYRLLNKVLEGNKFRLITPHSAFDWSTLAAEICLKKNLKYNMESDWNIPQVTKFFITNIRNPLQKIRKNIWFGYHNPKYMRCLRSSDLALVQAGDAYHAYKDIAPNAFPVLNIQLGPDDHIDTIALESKIDSLGSDQKLSIVYSGRAIPMKGPLLWLDVMTCLKRRRINFSAQWFGDGSELENMQKIVQDRGLGDVCSLEGQVERGRVFEATRSADLFVFCHMTEESPRCLPEALANGTPIVGFYSDYAKLLTEKHGGGRFVPVGDVDALCDTVTELATNPRDLGSLMRQAAASGQLLDRDKAIAERIALMKRYLG